MQSIPSNVTLSSSAAHTPLNVLNSPSESPAAPQENLPAWKKTNSYQTFTDLLARDTDRGVLTADGKELLDALLNPGPSQPTKVHVLSFGIHGVRANDMFLVRRNPPVPGKTNVMLYMPEKDTPSFHEFANSKDVHKFFKEIPTNPGAFATLLDHFGRDSRLESVETVRQAMQEFASAPENSKPAWGLGGLGYINSNVFERLEEWTIQSANTPIVNGLTDIQIKETSAQGIVTYIGTRPNGESVSFRYDMLGNLTGAGEEGNIYYLKNAKTSKSPLVRITPQQLGTTVIEDALKVIREEGAEGVIKALGDFLQTPFDWVSKLLEAFGVSKSVSGDIERFIDNPVTFLLLYGNKYNDLGKTLGKTKAEMDKLLTQVGDGVQGAVPGYGKGRALATLIGKAIKNEPLTDQEVRDGADALGLKP